MLFAFISMSAAILLGEPLAGAVDAVMYAGGNLLEDFAVARAERDLKSLVDRAPRLAHRRHYSSIEDVPIEQVTVGDSILVRAGEVVPVDGIILASNATLDEAALTGEPIPVTRNIGESVRSGTINAGATFELRASATAGESTYAGIVRLVTAAQTAKAPFIRLADRYALILLPVTFGHSGRGPGCFQRPDTRPCRARRLNPMPVDPCSTRGIHCGGVACGSARYFDQRRWATRSARQDAYRHV